MSIIKDVAKKDMIAAMKAKQKTKLDILRLLCNTVKNHEINNKEEADNEITISIIKKMIKQSKETQEEYLQAGRTEQYNIEKEQVEYLKAYLPPEPSKDEIMQIIEKALANHQSPSIKDLGRIISLVKQDLPPGSDMRFVTTYIKEKLS